MSDDVQGMAAKANDSNKFEFLARFGFVGSGIVHLLIAWIAGRVALGSSGEADQGGALEELSGTTGGGVLLWMCAVGFAALAVWHLIEALVPHQGSKREQLVDRAKAAGKAVLYGALAVTTFRVVTGGSADSGDSASEATSTLMGAPGGRILVGILGLAVLGAGGYHVYQGVKRKFLEDMRGAGKREVSKAVTALGTVGYAAKGVALGVTGLLFVVAAAQANPDQPTGLDAALKTLRDQPFGVVLLLVVAVGLAAYGLFAFARARYERL